jgi:urea transporter
MNKWLSIAKKGLLYSFDTIVNSYAVVFFSNNILFGLLLLLASFIDPLAGLCGLIGVISANVFSRVIGLNKEFIRKGYHGYDAMLVASGIAHYYTFNETVLLVIVCVGIFSTLISFLVHGILHKYNLPTLSFPFLISIWLVFSAFPSMSTMQVHPELIYSLNEKHKATGFTITHWLEWIDLLEKNYLHFPKSVTVYLKSLSSLFFQSNILSGILIALGLLIYSRIAFSLSILGFLSAYFFYPLLGGDVADFYEKFIGLNFIFLAIAIGGIYLVPSVASYLMTLILTPLLIILLFGLNKILYMVGLAPYSLPFTLLTILFLYVLNYRVSINYIHRVYHQEFSPEKNLYNFLNSNHRSRLFNFFPIHLPFWGEWMVSQAHDGKITHLGEWSKAFDFIILDNEMKSYQNPGQIVDDFYCYNKPVVACADGYVSTLVDNVEDNEIKGVNTIQNWGNSMVIYHADGLYSQVSHLKMGSLKYGVGDFVKKGEIIAYCGNSGRSPEPHIHFQLQESPIIGAKTLDFPIAYYIKRENNKFNLHTFSKPNEGDLIQGIEVNPLLKVAFDLIPGKKLSWKIKEVGKESKTQNWEVFTDSLNTSYVFCYDTKAVAYFYNDGNMLVFTSFYGSKKSLLYHFYLAHYKLALGFYQDLTINEKYPIAILSLKSLNFIQDFVAPFYRFVNANYSMKYAFIDDVNITSEIILESSAEIKVLGFKSNAFQYSTNLKDNKINEFIITTTKTKLIAVCENY